MKSEKKRQYQKINQKNKPYGLWSTVKYNPKDILSLLHQS